MNKLWTFYIIIAILIIGGLGYWGYKANVGKSADTTGPQVSGASTSENKIYYDNNATTMEFYQDTCEWCIKEIPILEKLGSEGYRVKPMNIGSNHPDNQKWWKDYNIKGTPTFVAKNGDHLEGYHDYASLKAWLDQHK